MRVASHGDNLLDGEGKIQPLLLRNISNAPRDLLAWILIDRLTVQPYVSANNRPDAGQRA